MDLTAQIIEAITAWLTDLTAQLVTPALAAVGALLFATPAFDQLPEVASVWSLVRTVTNALFVLAVLAAGILVMASGTAETRYSAKVLLPRLALAAIGANASLALAGELIRLNNALITGFLGADPAAATVGEFTRVLQGAHPINQYVTILIGLWAALLALLLVALYIGRDLALLLATVLAPLALATYALPQTDEIARFWLRVFTALVFVQLVQAVLVRVGLELLRHTDWLGGPISDLTSGLLLVTLLYLLFKLPFAAYHWALRQPIRLSPVALVTSARRIFV
jgi:hypothetical protein